MFQRVTFYHKTPVINCDINCYFQGLVALQKELPKKEGRHTPKTRQPRLREHDAHLASGPATSRLGNPESQGLAASA